MRDFYYVDEGGILSYPDGRVMTPKDAVDKINKLVRENTRYKDRLQIDPGGSDKIDELRQSNDFLRHRAETAEQQIEEWKDASGLECGGDPDGVTPTKVKEFWGKQFEAFRAQDIERQTDITALRHDLDVAEDEIQEAKELLGDGGDGTLKGRVESVLCELHEYKSHLRSIPNPPEATGEYVDVMGEMIIPFTAQLPVELCREPIACDDPAIEAALQAVSGYVCTYIWGEDKKPAVVYCDVGEQNVEIESDDRKCLEKDSTRLTDEAVNSVSCNYGELGQKRDQG